MSSILSLAVVLAHLQLSSAACTDLPIRLAGRVVPPSDSGEPTCPSDAERQPIKEDLNADLDQLIESKLHIFQNLAVPVECSGGGWVKVVDFNLETNGSESCPDTWQRHDDEGVAHCRIPTTSSSTPTCQSANFSTNSLSYSRVCGKIKGYQRGRTAAFSSMGDSSIDSAFLDGVLIARGSPRQHVWSFASGYSSSAGTGDFNCICSIHGDQSVSRPPEFVGDNNFCESGTDQEPTVNTFYNLNPLWDAEGCPEGSQCCSKGPYFSANLPEATCDPLEVRICVQNPSLVNIGVSIIELYVK